MNRRSISDVGKRFISIPKRPDYIWESHNLSFHWYHGALSSGVSGRGVKLTTHSPSSAEVKNEWYYISTPPYAFMACTVNTFTITFLFCSATQLIFQSHGYLLTFFDRNNS